MLSLGAVATAEVYARDGVTSARIISEKEAGRYRAAMEAAEAELGPLHYKDKVHTVLGSTYELATHPVMLDLVEAMIGPDILLYNATFIIKEPGTESFVSWHQDLTYWGLEDGDAQVSAWLALAPATDESGCMSMIPGSHRQGQVDHVESTDTNNVLLLGQKIEGIDTSQAQSYPLRPGEASFHHGWTVHASAPNGSSDRRIGLNVQYLAPHNKQLGQGASAVLVRGEDRYGYFAPDRPAIEPIDPVGLADWLALDDTIKSSFKTK